MALNKGINLNSREEREDAGTFGYFYLFPSMWMSINNYLYDPTWSFYMTFQWTFHSLSSVRAHHWQLGNVSFVNCVIQWDWWKIFFLFSIQWFSLSLSLFGDIIQWLAWKEELWQFSNLFLLCMACVEWRLLLGLVFNLF